MKWDFTELPDMPKPRLPYRYNWISLPRPWYFIFTFWSSRWENYGKWSAPIAPGQTGYSDAPYELAWIVDRRIKRIL